MDKTAGVKHSLEAEELIVEDRQIDRHRQMDNIILRKPEPDIEAKNRDREALTLHLCICLSVFLSLVPAFGSHTFYLHLCGNYLLYTDGETARLIGRDRWHGQIGDRETGR